MAKGKVEKRKATVHKNVVRENLPKIEQEKATLSNPTYVKWIVFLFALLLYADTLDLNYTLDDSLMVTQNTFTKKGVAGIKEIFTNDAFVGFLGKNNLLPGGRYRPLSQVMFAVEKEIFGFNPFVGHLLNILLYAVACMLLYVILQKLFVGFKANRWYLSLAFVATILFVAHPLHTEVVANIKGRDEILCLLFSLLTVYLSLKYIEKPRIYLLAINLLLFFLAILSKENALTFVAIIPLMLYVFTKAKPRDYVMVLAPLLLSVIFYFVLRVSMIGSRISNVNAVELLNDPFLGATLMQKYATIMLTWLKYLGLLFIPHPLTHDYYPKQIPIIGFNDYRALLSLLIFAGLFVFAFLKISKKGIIAFALLFFFITFSIVSNLVFNIGAFMNERFMFTSLLGFTVIVAYFITEVMRKKMKDAKTYRTMATVLLCIILVGYSAKTISRNRVWMDDFTLFTTDVNVSTNSTKCNTSAGGKLLEKADSTKNEAQKEQYVMHAIGYLNRAVEIYPQNLNAWLLLGNANIKLKNYEASRVCFENCLKMNPKYRFALDNLLFLAQTANKNSQYGEAIKCYKMLNQYKPNVAENYLGLGIAYREAKKVDSAVMALNRALEIKPKYVDALSKMGEVYGQDLNRLDQAEQYFISALNIDPKNESSLENMGIVYAIRRNFPLAISYFKKALEIQPDRYAIYTNMAQTYRSMGDKGAELDIMQRAQKYKPK